MGCKFNLSIPFSSSFHSFPWLQTIRITSDNFKSVTFVDLMPIGGFYLCIFDDRCPHTITLVILWQMSFNVAFGLFEWLFVHYFKNGLKGLIGLGGMYVTSSNFFIIGSILCWEIRFCWANSSRVCLRVSPIMMFL